MAMSAATASDGSSNAGATGNDAAAEGLLNALYSLDAQSDLTPAAVVERLDRFIVGQPDAKRAVAVAFRNRWRRHRVPPEFKDEIVPKNILMVGPTGCGKTEIARRLAKLADAPFVKVEATKFTEVGYHGRDVDSIVRDLAEAAVVLVREHIKKRASQQILASVEEQILSALMQQQQQPAASPAARPSSASPPGSTARLGAGSSASSSGGSGAGNASASSGAVSSASGGGGGSALTLEELRQQYRDGKLDSQVVELDLPVPKPAGDGNGFSIQGGFVAIDFGRMLGGGGNGASGRRERRRVTVGEARLSLEDTEVERMFPPEVVSKAAMRAAEQDGIVFIDEIDKIVQPAGSLRHGSDPSSEGVQRDLLPILEGSSVSTKHGTINTDHVLFICSGAFHSCKPSDMLPELQGRLPIRVELKGLSAADFKRILTEPEFNMIQQQQMLLAAEGVDLEFTDEAIDEIAALAEQVNSTLDNIGARRLHTVLERLVEEISFDAPERVAEATAGDMDASSVGPPAPVAVAVGIQGLPPARYRYVVDAEYVRRKVGDLLKSEDLSKYIL